MQTTERAITILLLLGQLLLGSARGQVICIPLQPCERHAAVQHASECDRASCAHEHSPQSGRADCHDHDRPNPLHDGPIEAHAPCACHLHVPLPDCGNSHAALTASGASNEFRLVAPMVLIASILAEPTDRLAPPLRLDFPDPARCARSLALKSTRLRL
jgi:hypothetical protein